MTRTHKKITFSLKYIMESRNMDQATWIMTGIPVTNDNWSFHVNLELKRQRGGEQVNRRACLHQLNRECPAWAYTNNQHCAGISCVIPAGATQGLSRHQRRLLCCTMCSDHRLKVNTGSSVRHTKQCGLTFHQCWPDVWVVGPEFKHSRIKGSLCRDWSWTMRLVEEAFQTGFE